MQHSEDPHLAAAGLRPISSIAAGFHFIRNQTFQTRKFSGATTIDANTQTTASTTSKSELGQNEILTESGPKTKTDEVEGCQNNVHIAQLQSLLCSKCHLFPCNRMRYIN